MCETAQQLSQIFCLNLNSGRLGRNLARTPTGPHGECISGQFVVASQPAITYTPAPEITNAAYPVRLEQLP